MKREIIKTNQAPTPIGPYNQAVLVNDTLYLSGQVAIDPQTGEFINDTIEKEIEVVMSNLKAILEAAKMDLAHVVKSTIYLVNMDDFSKINSIYEKYFTETRAPARETVQVSRLPKDANVEISMIASR